MPIVTKYTYTQNGIQFTDITNPSFKTGGKYATDNYQINQKN